MMPSTWVVVLALLVPAAAAAQTANGGPTDPAPQGLRGPPRSISRTPPSVGPAKRGMAPPVRQALPKETAADRAERLKLEKDLHICIGC